MKDLVTVYITSKDRKDLLELAVKSVLNQTYKNFELIVVDDGSETFNASELFSENGWDKDTRIRLIRNPQSLGSCRSRNLAINEAKGKYITGLDDDDCFHPQRIEILLRTYKEGDYSAVTSLCGYQRSPITSTELTLKHKLKQIVYQRSVIDLEKMKVCNYLNNQVFTETSKLRAIGGFDPSFPSLQDYDTWYRLIKQFGPALLLPDVLYFCYVHSKSITARMGIQLTGHHMFLEKHVSDFTSKDLENFAIRMELKRYGKVSFRTFFQNANSSNFMRCFYLLLRGRMRCKV